MSTKTVGWSLRLQTGWFMHYYRASACAHVIIPPRVLSIDPRATSTPGLQKQLKGNAPGHSQYDTRAWTAKQLVDHLD